MSYDTEYDDRKGTYRTVHCIVTSSGGRGGGGWSGVDVAAPRSQQEFMETVQLTPKGRHEIVFSAMLRPLYVCSCGRGSAHRAWTVSQTLASEIRKLKKSSGCLLGFFSCSSFVLMVFFLLFLFSHCFLLVFLCSSRILLVFFWCSFLCFSRARLERKLEPLHAARPSFCAD